VIIDEFFVGQRGTSPSLGLSGFQEGDAAQIAGDDPQAQPALHPVKPMIATLAPTIVTPQAGNPAFNPRSPPIAPSKGRRAFQPAALLRRFANHWNGYLLDPRSLGLLLRIGGVDPTIGCYQTGRASKHVTMMGDRINGLAMFFRMFQDLIARNQPSLVYGKDYFLGQPFGTVKPEVVLIFRKIRLCFCI